jgi:hypothetical protein
MGNGGRFEGIVRDPPTPIFQPFSFPSVNDSDLFCLMSHTSRFPILLSCY